MRIKNAYMYMYTHKQRQKYEVLRVFIYEFCSSDAADLLLVLQRSKFCMKSSASNTNETMMRRKSVCESDE